MFGLGVAGVTRVLDILQTQIAQTMANTGCATVKDVDLSIIIHVDAYPAGVSADQGSIRPFSVCVILVLPMC